MGWEAGETEVLPWGQRGRSADKARRSVGDGERMNWNQCRCFLCKTVLMLLVVIVGVVGVGFGYD